MRHSATPKQSLNSNVRIGTKRVLPDARVDMCAATRMSSLPRTLGSRMNDTPLASLPAAITASDIPTRPRNSLYPSQFAARVAQREKRALGQAFGLSAFGVNLTRLAPGAWSALRHAHSRQDEFIYVLEGHPVLYTDAGRIPLSPGMCAGFPAGTGNAHHLVNKSDADVLYLEIGDRTAGDEATYPDHDLMARELDGAWQFFHKDGSPY